MGEDIPPPAVARIVDAHVVGNDVKDDAQTSRFGGRLEVCERNLASQLRIHSQGVDDVVAMRAAAGCLEKGRAVQVADSELSEVRNDLGGAPKVETRMQLQPVGGGRGQLANRGEGRRLVERETGFEPATSTLARLRSTD